MPKRHSAWRQALCLLHASNMMNKKLLFLPVLLLLLTLGGIYFFSQGTVKKTSTVAIAPSAQNFIDQSAKEVQNPQAGKSDATVKDSVTQATPLASICLGADQYNFDCYQTYYANLVKNGGVVSAFADLRARYSKDNYVVAQCHPLAHIIGNVAVEKYASVAEAYAHGDSFCWSGYYHGVLEGIAGKMGSAKMFSSLNDICSGIAGKENYSFDYYNCVHGLGHGVMALTQDELFQSLSLCDKLTGAWEQQSCASGVFMENVIVDNKNHFTKYLKSDQPLYPCTAVSEQYKNTCFLMQTSYMLKVTNSDFAKVFGLCGQAPEAYRASCYQSLGRDASGRSSSNVTATKNACELGQSFDQKSNCIIGAAKDFVSYFHSDKQATELCSALATDLQKVCTQTVTDYYKTFN